MPPDCYIGVDPGTSGGLMAISNHTGHVAWFPFKELARVRDFLRVTDTTRSTAVLAVEEVWASPIMGVSNAFSFGRNIGRWDELLHALDPELVRIVRPTPQVWQKAVAPGLVGKGDARKNALKALARREADVRHPGLRLTLASCDAYLLALYASKLSP